MYSEKRGEGEGEGAARLGNISYEKEEINRANQ